MLQRLHPVSQASVANFAARYANSILRLATVAALSAMSLATLQTAAATLQLKTGFLDRSPIDGSPNVRRTVVTRNQNGNYPTMLGRAVHLERGIDPKLEAVPDNVPNYFTSLDASASERAFKISNRMSLSHVPLGTFPRPADPNFFTLSRTDYTGYASVGLSDTLLISGGTGSGNLNMSFRIFGTGSVDAPSEASVSATVCPKRTDSTGCSPMGVHAPLQGTAFDKTFNYTFPFNFGESFGLNMPFYSWIFIKEPTMGDYYSTDGTIHAMMDFTALSVTNVVGERVTGATIWSESGIRYFGVPEPSAAMLLFAAVIVGFGFARSRRVRLDRSHI